MKHRIHLLATLLLLVLLTACVSVETNSAPEEAAVDENSEERSSDECDEGFRLLDHELLTTDPVCIPDNPERVANLPYPSYLYPFNVNPVGSWGLERDAENFPFIADWIMEGTTDQGSPPNLEVLLTLEPDIFIAPGISLTEVENELREIAPVVAYDTFVSLYEWKAYHLLLGEVLNQEALAEEQIATFDQRVAELRDAIEANRGDVSEITVSSVRLMDQENILLLGPLATLPDIIKEIGFNQPDPVDVLVEEFRQSYDSYFVPISKEMIPLVDGDVIIVIGSAGGAQAQSVEGDQIISEMMQDPIWQTLNAVQTDDVHVMGSFSLNNSLVAAHMMLDHIADIFEIDIPTPNPFLSE